MVADRNDDNGSIQAQVDRRPAGVLSLSKASARTSRAFGERNVLTRLRRFRAGTVRREGSYHPRLIGLIGASQNMRKHGCRGASDQPSAHGTYSPPTCT